MKSNFNFNFNFNCKQDYSGRIGDEVEEIAEEEEEEEVAEEEEDEDEEIGCCECDDDIECDRDSKSEYILAQVPIIDSCNLECKENKEKEQRREERKKKQFAKQSVRQYDPVKEEWL